MTALPFTVQVTGTSVSIDCGRCGRPIATGRALTSALARSVAEQLAQDHTDRCVPRQRSGQGS